MGLDPSGLEFDSYSVPEVTQEVRQQTGPSYRLSVSSSSGKLKIQAPSKASMAEVSHKAKTLGDKVVLSGTDTGILALALDLSKEGKMPVIVSDDYAVQNVAEELKLPYQSLATLGIREKFNWVFYCPACFRRYPTSENEDCIVCGTKLKRKPLGREAAKQRSS
jgi:rRNA maturation endonuclease Nob1